MMRILPLAIGVFSCAFLVAGCSAESSDLPATHAPVPSSSASDASHAPHVANPVDVDQFKESPCAVLTGSQLEALGVQAVGKPEKDAALGPSCDWGDDFGPTGAHFSLSFLKASAGLTSVYENRDVELKVFQEIRPVKGYPAVLAMPSEDRDRGGCQYAIGLSDRQAMAVTVNLRGEPDPAPNYKNPCGVLQKISEEMMATITAGA